MIAPGGLKSVILWIQQNATGKYYNGHAYSSKKVIWNNGRTEPQTGQGQASGPRQPGSTAWTVPETRRQVHGARASLDQIGNVTAPNTQKTLAS